MNYQIILLITLLIFSTNACTAQKKELVKNYGNISKIAHLENARAAHTATRLADNNVLIAGGSEEAEIFDPETKSFEKISGSLGKSLHYASVTLLKDGRALILGGYEFVKSGEPTSTNQAWIFEI